MLVVTVELHGAVSGTVTQVGRMIICNDGTVEDPRRGNYDVYLLRKNRQQISRQAVERASRKGRVENHPRLSQPVWRLISKALKSVKMG